MASPESAFDPEAVRAEVDRILSSKTFHNAERLCRFLRYIVDQTLAGRAADIKEYSIGIEVFERGSAFDSRSDSVVRVEARRLRSKLRDYYDSEGASDPVIISIPKGSYVPVFRAPAMSAAPLEPQRNRMTLWAAVAGGILLSVASGWYLGRSGGGWGTMTRSVVVLPLENLSSDPANDNLCHALADQVAAQLSAGGQIVVQTRGPAGPFLARADLRELAAKHDAGYAFEGSASFSGDRMRVTVMLVELRRFSNVWLETYDRDTHDLLNTESELARDIAQKIRKQMP